MAWFSKRDKQEEEWPFNDGWNVPSVNPETGTIWYKPDVPDTRYYCGLHGWQDLRTPCRCMGGK